MALLTACATPPGSEIHDPLEPMNRTVHAVNKGLDRAVLAPGGKAYTRVLPDPVEDGIANLADTLDLPG